MKEFEDIVLNKVKLPTPVGGSSLEVKMTFSDKEGQDVRKTAEKECVREYEVKMTGDAFKRIEQQTLVQLQSSVNLPGFRRGKVPLEMIKEQFPSMLKEKMFDISAKEVLRGIMSRDKIIPVVTPILTEPNFSASESISFKLKMECAPRFEIRNYENIKAVRKKKTVSDEETNEYIEQLRNYNAYLLPVAQDKSLDKSHYAIYDYEAFENGSRLEENSGKNEIIFMENPGQAIAGLPEAILGAKKGETRQFYSEAGGRKLHFKVLVKEIKEKKLPEMNEDFFKQFGAKTLAEMKENVKTILQRQEENRAEKEMVAQIEDALMKSNAFPLPPTLIKEEARELTGIFKKRAPETARNMKDEELEEKLKPAAERNLRMAYILNAVAKKENITATDEDFEKELSRALEKLQSEEEKGKIRNVFARRKEYIMATITENKAMELIKSKAKIEETAR